MSSRGAQGSGSRGRGDRGGGRGRGDRGDFRGGRGGGRGGSSYDGPSDSRAGSEAGTSGGSWKGGFRGRGGGGDRGGSRGGRGGYGGGNTIFNPGELSQPDPVVTETENQVVSSPSLAGLSLSDSMPPRPGYITEGRKVILRANYFQLSAIKDLPLYEYSLTIYPTESNMPQRTKPQIYRLLLEHPDLKKVTACTDFEQTLITTPALDSARVKVPIVYRYEDETSPREDAKTYTVAIGDQTAINVENLRDYLEAKSRTPFEGKDRILKALNILVAKTPENMSDVVCYNQRYFPVGPTMQMTSLGGGIVAIRGFFSSVRTATARTLLNVNPCTGAFVRPGSLLDTMNEFLRSGGSVSQLSKFLRGVRIQIKYPKGTKGMPATRTKTIANIPQSPRDKRYGIAREVRFKLSKVDKNGNPTSSSPTIAQYFKEERGIELTRPDFLVVNVGSTDPKGHQEFWPPELCEVVPGHLTKVKLTPNQTTEMLGVAARKPAENAEFIVGEGARVTGLAAPQSNLASFGFRGNPNMITVEGHVLSPPKVKYSTKSRQPDVVPRNGQWNMAEKKFTNGATIPSWTSLNLCQTSVARDIDTFKQGMINCGMRVPDSVPPNGFRATIQEIPQGDEVPAAEKERIEKENKEAVRKALEQASKTARMVLVILPDNRASTYAIVKQLGDIEVGIHTVCSVYNKFTRTKGQDQYMANVALKVNLKFGGTNQAISTDKLGILSDGKTMLVGMDVTHPSAFSQEGTPSVAAVVANHDPLYSQWPGSVRCQTGRQEMIQDLEEMLIERLRLWRDKNRGLPSRVIVYRDGVSEGQFKLVLMNEKPAIDRALRKMYAGGKAPPLSIVVVGKRHHTRFYPTKAEDADERTGNPLNGTTVDRGVTHERLFDFYLQAHRGLQGTARPGHYTVIWDENKFTANTLQTLTHNLCYLFGRATLAVSICPPAYYADLICDRARNYLYKAYNESSQGNIKIKFDPLHAWSGGVHERLKDSMFYI